jgi:hypothetical protein
MKKEVLENALSLGVKFIEELGNVSVESNTIDIQINRRETKWPSRATSQPSPYPKVRIRYHGGPRCQQASTFSTATPPHSVGTLPPQKLSLCSA